MRERWRAHIESTLFGPVLIVDEAREMRPAVLSELRFLASAELDARALLTVGLAGDHRLTAMFRIPELVPLGSRVRVRLAIDAASSQELAESLRHALQAAGVSRKLSQLDEPLFFQVCGAPAARSAGKRR